MAMLTEPKHYGNGETIPRGHEELYVGGVRFIVNGEEQKQRILRWHAEDMARKEAAKKHKLSADAQ